jgi:hypothetical protein
MANVCHILGIDGPEHEDLCQLVLSPDEELFVTKAATELGLFSTFSGFLAALAFASLMILVTNPPKSKHGEEAFMISIFSLIIVFALLLLSTFLFIPITGSVFRPEQDIGFLISDTILAVAVCELFLSLSWFFAAYRLARKTRRAAIVTFYFVIFVIALNMSAVLVNIGENLRTYYPNEIKNITPIYTVIIQVGAPIVIAIILRVTLFDRFKDELWLEFTRFILYISMVFTIMLISSYVYLFSRLWDRTVLPFPHNSSDALAIGLGLVLASCVLALPRSQREQ